MKVAALAPHFQIELTREGRMDVMTVHVEASGELGHDGRNEAAANLASRIKDVVGITAQINVRDAGAVARSEGKAVRLVDKRPKE